jgi:hypothetical protein
VIQDPLLGSVKLVVTCENRAHPGCLQVALRHLIFIKTQGVPDGDSPVLALCDEHWPLWVDEGHRRGYFVWSSDLYGPHQGVLAQI